MVERFFKKMKNIKQKKVEILKEEPTVMTRTIQEMHAESDKRVGQVFQTMLIFTVLMVLGPISTYFLSKVYVFESKRKTDLNSILID